MRVRLLGTGSADRWPNPWCRCASCEWARSTGSLRDRTSALVDGSLLVDPGPDAGGRGVDLSRVRTVLITHDHPDHLDPAFLLAWQWAALANPIGQDSPRRGLLVAGPATSVERCRGWTAPGAPVELRVLAAGDTFGVGEHVVRALRAAHSTTGGHDYDGTALLYDITGTDGRLLYATDTAGLPHDHLADRYDVVLLEETFGDFRDHGTAHLDLPSFAREVDALRGAGRLTPESRVVAVHLSHHNGPSLATELAAIGAEVLPDDAVVSVGIGDPARPTQRLPEPSSSADGPTPAVAFAPAAPERDQVPPRRLLVTGGARSGKSHYAETIVAARGLPITYVATAPSYPDDPEWQLRVAAHRARRPTSWRTVESADVAGALRDSAPGECLLVDCLTLWLTGVLDRTGWDAPQRATPAVHAAVAETVAALRDTPADVVLVTNEVGSGVVPDQPSGRLFRDLLGHANVSIAAACSDVVMVTAGIPVVLKGAPWTSST